MKCFRKGVCPPAVHYIKERSETIWWLLLKHQQSQVGNIVASGWRLIKESVLRSFFCSRQRRCQAFFSRNLAWTSRNSEE